MAWPLSEIYGDVVATGIEQVGAETSCLQHRGQPYWQVQLQIDNPAVVEVSVLYPLLVYILAGYPEQAWCSETVAFWHRQAAVPYPVGYSAFLWHPSSYVQNVASLKLWYQTEEVLSLVTLPLYGRLGRGRWIDSDIIDYADFQPGINAPCPGAYQALAEYDRTTGTWPSTSCTHSQVVDSVVIHHSGSTTGPITSVDVLVVEGNAGGGSFTDIYGSVVSRGIVNHSTWYYDVFQYTPGGTGSTGTCSGGNPRLILGWGVDRYSDGSTYSDAGRIRDDVVSAPVASRPRAMGSTRVAATDPDSALAVAIRDYVLTRGGPILVTASSQAIQADSLPTPEAPWTLSPAPPGADTAWIEIDLRANHPLAVRGVVFDWKSAVVPGEYAVRWAAEGEAFQSRLVDVPAQLQPQPGTLPISTTWESLPPQHVRRLRLAVPATSLTRSFQVTGAHILFRHGGGEDEPVSVPNTAIEPGLRTAAMALRVDPNPFRDVARLRLPGGDSDLRITVYDIAGRRVRDLGTVSGGETPSLVLWDGRDDSGRDLAPGFYWIRARGAGVDLRRSVIRIR